MPSYGIYSKSCFCGLRKVQYWEGKTTYFSVWCRFVWTTTRMRHSEMVAFLEKILTGLIVQFTTSVVNCRLCTRENGSQRLFLIISTYSQSTVVSWELMSMRRRCLLAYPDAVTESVSWWRAAAHPVRLAAGSAAEAARQGQISRGVWHFSVLCWHGTGRWSYSHYCCAL